MKPTPVMAFTDNYAARVRARLADRIAVTPAGCWEWTGSRDRHGYGRMKVLVEGVKRETGAHRASWIVHRGAIPNPTLQTDHLCRNRACINPDHMELVTNQVNTLRSDHSGKAGRSGRRRGRQLHSCGKHGRQDGYLRTQPDGYTRWECRICRRARVRLWRLRQRQAD